MAKFLMYKDARLNLDFLLDPLYFRNLLRETKSWASQSFLLFVRLLPYWLRGIWWLPRAQLATWSHSGNWLGLVCSSCADGFHYAFIIHSFISKIFTVMCKVTSALICFFLRTNALRFVQRKNWHCMKIWLFDSLSTLSLIDMDLKSAEI